MLSLKHLLHQIQSHDVLCSYWDFLKFEMQALLLAILIVFRYWSASLNHIFIPSFSSFHFIHVFMFLCVFIVLLLSYISTTIADHVCVIMCLLCVCSFTVM